MVFDPLDGSSNIDAGVNVGTIFGVYKVVRRVWKSCMTADVTQKEGSKGTKEDVLRPGKEMVAAGIYHVSESAPRLHALILLGTVHLVTLFSRRVKVCTASLSTRCAQL